MITWKPPPVVCNQLVTTALSAWSPTSTFTGSLAPSLLAQSPLSSACQRSALGSSRLHSSVLAPGLPLAMSHPMPISSTLRRCPAASAPSRSGKRNCPYIVS
eukprot:scaffold13094_cov70-Phaeocystis_antarctica.AAC.2